MPGSPPGPKTTGNPLDYLLGSALGSLTPKDMRHKHPWDNQHPRITGTPRITLQDLQGSITPVDIGTTGHSTPTHEHPRMAKSCSCPFRRSFYFSLGESSFPWEILHGLNFQLLYKPLEIDYYKEKAGVHTLLSLALGLSRRYYSNKVNCKELKPSKRAWIN